MRRAHDSFECRRLVRHLKSALVVGPALVAHPDADQLDALDVYLFDVGMFVEHRRVAEQLRPTNRAQRRVAAKRAHRQRAKR